MPNLMLIFSANAEPFCLLSVRNKKSEILKRNTSFLKKKRSLSWHKGEGTIRTKIMYELELAATDICRDMPGIPS